MFAPPPLGIARVWIIQNLGVGFPIKDVRFLDVRFLGAQQNEAAS
jgi:hypothetical protein